MKGTRRVQGTAPTLCGRGYGGEPGHEQEAIATPPCVPLFAGRVEKAPLYPMREQNVSDFRSFPGLGPRIVVSRSPYGFSSL